MMSYVGDTRSNSYVGDDNSYVVLTNIHVEVRSPT